MATVEQAGDEWGFACDVAPCGFTSAGWPTKKVASARLAQHLEEHETGEAMQELGEFRVDQGVVVNDDGSASMKG